MSVFPYRYVTDHCFAPTIGAAGLTEAEFRPVLAETAPALEQLRAWHGDGDHPFLNLPARRDDLPVIEAAAGRFREAFDSVVILGTGGSSLGGITLTSLVRPIIDNYWQTETGWPILTICNGVEKAPSKFGSPGKAVYGYDVKLVNESTCEEVQGADEKGVVMVEGPLPPGCMQTVWQDDARFVKPYWSQLNGRWL